MSTKLDVVYRNSTLNEIEMLTADPGPQAAGSATMLLRELGGTESNPHEARMLGWDGQ